MKSDTKQSLENRVHELEAELKKQRVENVNLRQQLSDRNAKQSGLLPTKPADPLASHVVSSKALKKFVFEELPTLMHDGNDVGLRPAGLVAFVYYPGGSIYAQIVGTVDYLRVAGLAQHFLSAHTQKYVDNIIRPLVDNCVDPELRRRLERGV